MRFTYPITALNAAICFFLLSVFSAIACAEKPLSIPAGQSVSVMNGSKVLATVDGPIELTVIGKAGQWFQVELPNGKGRGFVRNPELAKDIPSGTASSKQKSNERSKQSDPSVAGSRDVLALPTEQPADVIEPSLSVNRADTEMKTSSQPTGKFSALLTRKRGYAFRKPAGTKDSPLASAHCVAFSADGRFLCVGENNVRSSSGYIHSHFDADLPRNELAVSRLLDLNSGKEVRRLAGHKGATHVLSASFSGDGKYACTTGFTSNDEFRFQTGIVASDKQEAIIWDLETGESLFRIPKLARLAAFSADGRWLVTIGKRDRSTYVREGVLSVYDISNLERVKQLPLRWQTKLRHDEYIQPLISHSGKYVFARRVDNDAVVCQYEMATGKFVRKFDDGEKLAISKDDRLLAVATSRGVTIWDIARGAKVRRFEKKDQRFEFVTFADAGQQFVAINSLGMLFRWDVQSGNLFNQLDGFKGSKAISPNDQVIACTREKAVDLVDINTGQAFLRYTQFQNPRTSQIETINGAIAKTGQKKSVESKGRPLINLSNAGSMPSSTPEDDAIGDQVTDVLSMAKFVDVPKSKPKSHPKSKKPISSRRRLLVLAVGVSRYQFPEYNLAFAENDATQFSDYFVSQDKLLYDVVVQKYVDQNATGKNLRRGLQWLTDSCRESDIAVILFAGHGIKGRNGLYFMPHEGDQEGIQHTCVNWTDVAKAVQKIRSKNILMFNDCCHAGDFGIANRPTQTEVMKAFSQKKGLLLYCSSQGDQLSLESPDWKHGLFTFAVLNALQGRSGTDNDGDGFITLRELKTHVDSEVTKSSSDEQTPFILNEADVDWNLRVSKVADNAR